MKFRYEIKGTLSQTWANNFNDFLQEIENAGFAGPKDGTIECEEKDIAQVNAIAVKHHLQMNFFKQIDPQQDNVNIRKNEM